MTTLEVSYLVRYLFHGAFFAMIWLLFRSASLDLKWKMRNRVLPVPGYSLMVKKSGADPGPQTEDRIRVMHLWHTTVLGKSRSCDARLQGEGIGKRHAVVYLYDGKWHVRPAGPKQSVQLNGEEVRTSSVLHHLDTLMMGDHELYFVNRLQDADPLDRLQILEEDAPPIRPPHTSSFVNGAWISADLFLMLSSALLVFLIPASMPTLRMALAVASLVFFTVMNLIVWLLPLALEGADRILLICLLWLSSLGLLIQTRLSLGRVLYLDGTVDAALAAAALSDMFPQAISMLAGWLLLPLLVVITARTRLPEPLGVAGVVLTPLLLIATRLLGRGGDTHGATLWIDLGGFSLQLTEFAKITWLPVLAWFFKNRPTRRQQILFACWALLVIGLFLSLPDLGALLILLPASLLVYVVMTSGYLTAALLSAGAAITGTLAYTFFPHVQRRLAGWISLWQEVNDGNRQIVYGLQAISRGGLTGRGIGNGSPSGIPLASSDMVFAVVSEEMGLITGLGIVLVFIVIWLRAAGVALTARDGFTSALALSAGTIFFCEAAVVIAGVTGLLPLTGATLPLIAKGGSSVLAKLVLYALLVGLSARQTEVDTT